FRTLELKRGRLLDAEQAIDSVRSTAVSWPKMALEGPTDKAEVVMRRTFMIMLSAFIWAAVHFIIISSGVSIVTARGIVQNAGYPISDTPIFEQFTVNLILFALLFAIAGVLFYTLRLLDVKDILLWVTV